MVGCGHSRGDPLRHSGRQGRPRLGRRRRRRDRPARRRRRQVRRARPVRDHRRVHVRVHGPRSLRDRRRTATWPTIPSVERLAATALSHARAGADVVAPSDMMDGRVGGDPHGARSMHGFERACRSSPTRPSTRAPSTGPSATRPRARPQFGDRRSLPDGSTEPPRGLREMRARSRGGRGRADGEAGAPYLDILAAARREFDVPLAAYHVSGRVRDDSRRRRARLDRRRARHGRGAGVDQARRGGSSSSRTRRRKSP